MIVATLALASALANVTPETLRAVAYARQAQAQRAATLTPEFRGAAAEFQTADTHEVILAGPAETGKTYAGLWKLDSVLRGTPRVRGVLARKVRADMGGSVMGTWERVAGIRGMPAAFGGSSPEWYDYPNGSRLFIVGMDRPGKVLSGEFDVIYGNQLEEFRLEDWETLATRCTGRGSVVEHTLLCGDCNPGPPSHWILARPSIRVLHSRHEDNPTLYNGTTWTEQGKRTLEILDSLTGVRKERLRHGRWVSAEGVVYEGFDRGTHVVPWFQIPAEWRRVRSIDFGYTNPFVCQWWAADPDGRAYLYREMYRTRTLVEDHARRILELSGDEKFEATVADHDAEDRATLHRHGVTTIAAQKAVTPGLQAVAARLSKAGDGKPRLFVLDGALVDRDESLAGAHRPVCTAEEFEAYSWPKDAAGKALKEEPVKENDHGMDAARYFVAHVDGLSNSGRAFVDHLTALLAKPVPA